MEITNRVYSVPGFLPASAIRGNPEHAYASLRSTMLRIPKPGFVDDIISGQLAHAAFELKDTIDLLGLSKPVPAGSLLSTDVYPDADTAMRTYQTVIRPALESEGLPATSTLSECELIGCIANPSLGEFSPRSHGVITIWPDLSDYNVDPREVFPIVSDLALEDNRLPEGSGLSCAYVCGHQLMLIDLWRSEADFMRFLDESVVPNAAEILESKFGVKDVEPQFIMARPLGISVDRQIRYIGR